MFTTFKIFTESEIEANYSTIGKPIPGSRIAVLNEKNIVLPVNSQGELVVYEDENSIQNIAKGYLNLPEQTSKKFIKFYNPICGSIVNGYKTGDIVKINNNLEIEFIGRNDDIVKVNGGYLVALNEVEKRVSSLLGDTIESYCVAVPYKNSKAIVLFVHNNEKTISLTHIKMYLKENLSFYMQPKKIVEIDEIPRNTSGKVHRQALKNLAIEELKVQCSNIVKPRTSVELEIYNVIKDCTHTDDFSITDDFLDDLSIDSLSLTSISVALSNYKLGMQDFYTYSCVQDLAQFIENKTKDGGLLVEVDGIDKIDIPMLSAKFKNDESENTNLENTNLKNTKSENLNLKKAKSENINTKNTESENAKLKNAKLENPKTNDFDLTTVLITGVTGFLGIHLLHELLLNKKVKQIYCIIRNKIGIEASERLKKMIDFYYNSDEKLFKLIEEKVIILNGEITKPNFNLSEDTYMLLQNSVKTVINCAANVKHFSKPEQIRSDNIGSVDNIINFCGSEISLAHISTLSVAGFKGRSTLDKIFDENTLYIKQTFNNNPYLVSKFNGEKHILESIRDNGLHAKIFRLGNIMPRKSDGVFQKNYNQNIFITAMKTIMNLNVICEEFLDIKVEFSPVDECAISIMNLINDNTSVIYHILNNNEISIRDILRIYGRLDSENSELIADSNSIIDSDENTASLKDTNFTNKKFKIVTLPYFRSIINSLEDRYVKEYILGVNLNKFSQDLTLKCLKNHNFSWSESDKNYLLNIAKTFLQ